MSDPLPTLDNLESLPGFRWTGGPWKWVQGDLAPEAPDQWTLSPGILIAQERDGTPGGDVRDRANARLIEAAPDLYEALDEALAFIGAWAGTYASQHGLGDIHPKHAESIAKTQSALRKARGEDA